MTARLQIKETVQGNGGMMTKSYTNLGYLENITRREKNGGSILTTAMDWQFDLNPLTGNLSSRSDNLRGLAEIFTYDDLDRLTEITLNNSPALNLAYDPSGNIASKSDAGGYRYAPSRPHAVERIEGNDLPLLQQDITYTPFNKAQTVTEGDHELMFTYGFDYQRRISELKENGETKRKVIYTGNYEEVTTTAGTHKVHYITSPDGLAAMHVISSPPLGEPEGALYYVHTDHLGSIVALYDQDGSKTYEQNFDAWGRERNPADWTYTPNPATKPEWLIRGYTGHEHHDEFALINMNGRMYDPLVGRVLSPDNFVQEATGTQGYNRYSYAFNNPTKYTDPDGDNPIIAIAMIAAFGSAAYTGYQGGSPGQIATAALIGGASGVVGGFVGIGAYSVATNALATFANSGITATSIAFGAGLGSAGFVYGFGTALNYGGSFREAVQAGGNLAGYGASLGTGIGLVLGIVDNLRTAGNLRNLAPPLPDFTPARDVLYASTDPYIGVTEQGGGSIDFQKASDVQKIIHISEGIRRARQSGQDFIDMRQLFSNFPQYGSGVDIAGNIKIGENTMSVHMNLAIYSNMRIDIYPARSGQVGPFRGVNVRGINKQGYWDFIELNRAGGNIPMLMIQTNTNFDIFYNYLYK